MSQMFFAVMQAILSVDCQGDNVTSLSGAGCITKAACQDPTKNTQLDETGKICVCKQMFVISYKLTYCIATCKEEGTYLALNKTVCIQMCSYPAVGHLDGVCREGQCPINQELKGSKCVCNPQSKQEADDTCTLMCNFTYAIYNVASSKCICESEYILSFSKNKCDKSCAQGFLIEGAVGDRYCVETCEPSHVVSIDGVTCMPSCLPGQTNQNGKCKCAQFIGENNSQCVTECQPTSVIGIGEICLSECPAGQFIDNVRYCVLKCKSFIDISGKRCKEQCDQGQVANTNKTCSCEKMVAASGLTCVDSCLEGEFSSSDSKKCLASCPSSEFIALTGKSCVANCWYDQVNVSGRCVCDMDKNFVFDAGAQKCLCSMGFKPVEQSCVCEQAVVNGVCQRCPPTSILVEGKCVCRDSQNQFYDPATNSCLDRNTGILSSGAVVGIVIAVAVVLVAIGVAIYILYSRKLRQQELKLAEKQTVMDTPHTYL